MSSLAMATVCDVVSTDLGVTGSSLVFCLEGGSGVWRVAELSLDDFRIGSSCGSVLSGREKFISVGRRCAFVDVDTDRGTATGS